MVNWTSRLRTELSSRAQEYAKAGGHAWYESLGKPATTLFPAHDELQTHGNFIAASYDAILKNPPWAKRLEKVHTQRHGLPAGHGGDARELDSCNSSDALLMNCFCYPLAAEQIFAQLLPSLTKAQPEFGVDGSVPLIAGGVDTTELDMRYGGVIFESKLTEADFTSRPLAHLQRYKSLDDVFDLSFLPHDGETYRGYQLIRNVLAAHAHKYHFVLLIDARRPDLLHEWWQVHGAIREGALRGRCSFLFWQEVALAAPAPLRTFLQAKYGL